MGKAVREQKYGKKQNVEIGLLRLGNRRDGAEYTVRDRRALKQTADALAAAIRLGGQQVNVVSSN